MANERKRRVQLGTPWTIVALLVGWIVVVVVGGGREPDQDPLLGVDGVGMVITGALALLALVGLILIIYLKPQREDGWQPPQRKKANWVPLIVVLAVLWIWRPKFLEAMQRLAEERSDQEVAEDGVFEVPGAEPAAESVAQATDLLLIVLVASAVVALWFVARRRATPPVQVEATDVDLELEAELLVAIEDASVELSTGDDPRTAVLRAYASLERVLASRDNQRRPSETATEHLRRALANLRVEPDPLIQLGALYELARFSTQDISIEQQQQAAKALEESRDQLAALT